MVRTVFLPGILQTDKLVLKFDRGEGTVRCSESLTLVSRVHTAHFDCLNRS